MLSYIRQKLWMRVMGVMALVIIFVLAGIIWLNIASQRRLSDHQLALQNEMLASAVEGGMFDALAIGDNDVVRTQFKRLSKKLSDLKVFVYDFNGKISFSTEPSSVGESIDGVLGAEAVKGARAMMASGKTSDRMFHDKFNNEPFSIVNNPIANESRCFHCHGSSKEVLGGISVCSSEQAALSAIASSRTRSLVFGAAGIVLIVFSVWFLFHKMVNKRVVAILDATGKMRQGDFTREIKVTGKDEISHIIARINRVNQEMRTIISGVMDSSSDLSDSSADLNAISKSLLAGATETSGKSHAVSAAAEEMSSNLNSIAASMEQTASNVTVVASSSEEMNSTVNEISENAGTAKSVIEKAVADFSKVASVVAELGRATEDIDLVTDEIKSISEQVGLLALNAKIEAARAGEAGKGFAVVAQEITELATETSDSTVKVDEKLQWMKTKAAETAAEIETVSKTVNDSEEAISTIAAAVEEQTITSKEIASNIAQISQGVSVVNDNVGQGAAVAKDVSRDITVIDQAAGEMETNSSQVNDKASSLSTMADSLKEMMKKFTV
ncbi:MAG TPA: HAMP domain-containing methyl-accepting chemotaxis protein [Desulfobacteraceae bacterium]|nr:HAMP domain-containing methyl-accepting chemotaxis protein [Desulfobacteraceae bacterium]